jgi:uncharacterized protein
MGSLLPPHKLDHRVMNRETLKKTVDFFCSGNDDVEFVWHGGEPLLVGKSFYRDAVEFQKNWREKGVRISNFIQTNGTLVDESWATFLSGIDFTVGVSLDLPKNTNNKLRKINFHSKSGSYKQIVSGIKRLEKNKIFNGISCCVGKDNHLFAKEIIETLDHEKIKSVKFLRIKDDTSDNSDLRNSISIDEYIDFLIKIFDLWIEKDDLDLEIRDIKSAVDIFLGGNFRECVYLGKCEQFATAYSDGSIFPCDNFLNNPKFMFGTVYDSFNSVVNSKNFRSFLELSKALEERCLKCQWNFICRGGCSYEKYYLTEKERLDICRAKDKFFTKIKNVLLDYDLL